MHLVFRLTEHPVRLYDGESDRTGQTLGHAIVGGVRSTFYMKDVSEPVRSVGAQIHPGACRVLFGVTADELAGRHTPLHELWGAAADAARARLVEEADPGRQLDLLETILSERLPRVRALHPAVAHALGRFATGADVGQVVREAGWSHRWFIALFRRAMGLNPKTYSRLQRFQGAVRRASGRPETPWSEVALEAGYSDQSHFNREFRQFAGVTPGEYRLLAPSRSHHVPFRTERRS
jgi:AraC-like DNA-binding protein